MHIFTSMLVMVPLLFSSVWDSSASSLKATNVFPAVDSLDFVIGAGTNLMSFGPFSPYPLESVNEMLRTNGLECWVGASRLTSTHNPRPLQGVYIYNYATNEMTCLRMPATNICRIALLDQNGHQVKKTKVGEMYGGTLSQEQIEKWRRNWSNSRQSVFIRLFPNGIPQYADLPREVCNFSINEAFEIKEPGDYELHVQIRFIQAGTDSSGKMYYPITWLPETAAKVQIRSEDIQ